MDAAAPRTRSRRPLGLHPRPVHAAWVVMVAALAASFSAFTGPAARAASSSYFVDCASGSDTRNGTTAATAWKTIDRANNVSLFPGNRLLLKRGCTWNASLRVRWSGTSAAPITIGAYGTGAAPRLQNTQDQFYITGSHLIIQDLQARADPVTYDAQCQNARAGRRTGFRVLAGASHDILRRLTASDLFIGIKLDTGSHNNRVLDSVARNNNMKSDIGSSDAGAVGIAILGDDNEVARNVVSGSDVCSRFYGRDGSAIEVFGGQRNRIHHNRAIDNNQFTELGNSRSADNTYAYNVVTSSLPTAHFFTTRGAKDTKWGPVWRTKVYNNSVYLSGTSSLAISCAHGCNSSILSLRNNIIWARGTDGFADGAFDEGNNIYWRPGGALVWYPIASSSRKVDPAYVAPASGNLHLQLGSKGINAGSSVALGMGFTVDFDGAGVPFGGAVDIGAYERH
jgi:hypothetical protein